jgi:hypothetical protein
MSRWAERGWAEGAGGWLGAGWAGPWGLGSLGLLGTGCSGLQERAPDGADTWELAAGSRWPTAHGSFPPCVCCARVPQGGQVQLTFWREAVDRYLDLLQVRACLSRRAAPAFGAPPPHPTAPASTQARPPARAPRRRERTPPPPPPPPCLPFPRTAGGPRVPVQQGQRAARQQAVLLAQERLRGVHGRAQRGGGVRRAGPGRQDEGAARARACLCCRWCMPLSRRPGCRPCWLRSWAPSAPGRCGPSAGAFPSAGCARCPARERPPRPPRAPRR